jgi:hypothetical protein
MQEDTRACQFCGAHILARCFDIHSRACANKIARNSATKKSVIRSGPVDLIPCAECGEMVDFLVFSQHMEECVGRQLMKCPNCKLLYPTFLFEEHAALCNEFREEEPEYRQGEELLQIEEDEEEGLGEDEALLAMIGVLAKNNSDNEEPLPMETINKMRRYVIGQSEECSICYCEVTKGTSIMRLHCPHKYHPRCLTAWLQKNPHCPMCRRHVLY